MQRVRDEGDWESFIKFFLEGTREVSQDAVNTAKKIQQLKEKQHRIIIEQFRVSQNALLLLDRLFITPYIKVKHAKESLDISYVSANKLIKSFEDVGILVEITGQKRNRIYTNKEYTDLFP